MVGILHPSTNSSCSVVIITKKTMEDVSTNENHSIPSSLSSSRRSEFEIEANMKLEEDISIVKSSLRQLIQMGGDETPSQSSNSGNRSCCNEQERRAMSADCEENDDDEAKPPPIFPKHWNELFAVLPGVLMVILFGYTYAAIVISGNPQLENHAGFLLFWSQISNIAITLSAVLVGSTKWVVGGANTTSAIMLKILLENANIETALFVQGISSLFAAILFIGIANFGGLGRLFGDKNANVALYADYIHLSLVMALSHATALLMMKFALEISVHGDVLKFTGEWFRNLFKSDAISVWVPGLILGGLSAYVDLRLRNQMIAMTILFVLPLALFIGISTSLGLDIIPSHHYWNIKSDAIDTFQNLDFNNNIDFVQIAKKMPLCILGAIVIFIEAQAVYKSFSVVVPERRSIKKDNISCGLAHIVIGCLGGWFGHQVRFNASTHHISIGIISHYFIHCDCITDVCRIICQSQHGISLQLPRWLDRDSSVRWVCCNAAFTRIHSDSHYTTLRNTILPSKCVYRHMVPTTTPTAFIKG